MPKANQMPKGAAHSTLLRRSLIALLAFSGILLQASMQSASSASTVATGAWGGQGILVQVSEKGAEVEFDCARGQIAQPITLDKHGDFEVAGTFTAGHGGPVRRDENPQAAPARYSGHVDGDAMSLTVSRGEEKVGSYSLTRGSQPHLTKCL